MFNKIFNSFVNIDKLTYLIMKKGFIFCFALSIISSVFFFTYIILGTSLNSYYIGLALFKLSCYLCVEFIVCGLVVDGIAKNVI